jgi:hypothetical protein
MKYSELTEAEKRIWEYVYAMAYVKAPNTDLAADNADMAIYGFRRIQEKKL